MTFYTMMWMLRALWLVVAHDLSEYRYMDDVPRNLLFLFCSTGARFWKFLWDYFGSKQVKASKKVQQELFTRKKNGETGLKELLTTVECLNYKKSSQQLASRVSSLWETRRFAKCFRHKREFRNHSVLSKKRRWKTFQRNCIQFMR